MGAVIPRLKMEEIKIQNIFKIAVPLLVEYELLGTVAEVRTLSFKGRLHFPAYNPKATGESSYNLPLVAPDLYETGILNLMYKDINWGRPYSYPDKKCFVETFLLELELNNEASRDVRKSISEAGLEIEAWFLNLRDWAEVITHQDLYESDPYTFAKFSDNRFGLWACLENKEWRNKSPAEQLITITMIDDNESLSMGQWKYMISMANQSVPVSTEYLLLRDARAQLYRDQFRRSVLDSGIVGELILRNKVSEVLKNLGGNKENIKNVTESTFGSLINLALTMPDLITLPDDIKKLNTIRNSAVHYKEKIDATKASMAIKIASELVEIHLPLPIELND